MIGSQMIGGVGRGGGGEGEGRGRGGEERHPEPPSFISL